MALAKHVPIAIIGNGATRALASQILATFLDQIIRSRFLHKFPNACTTNRDFFISHSQRHLHKYIATKPHQFFFHCDNLPTAQKRLKTTQPASSSPGNCWSTPAACKDLKVNSRTNSPAALSGSSGWGGRKWTSFRRPSGPGRFPAATASGGLLKKHGSGVKMMVRGLSRNCSVRRLAAFCYFQQTKRPAASHARYFLPNKTAEKYPCFCPTGTCFCRVAVFRRSTAIYCRQFPL